jgi:hypothetical protein
MLRIYFVAILCLGFKVKRAEVSINVNKDSLYNQQVKIFINDIYAEKLKSKGSVLIEEPQSRYDLKYSDTSFFTKEELSSIKKQVENPKVESWRNIIGTNMKCIDKDSLNRILNKKYLRLYNGWDYFYKYVGNDIYNFSSPIFIRNYQYCIFYSEINCGFKCASGELYLYRKENEKWKKFRLLYSWIS